MESSDDDVPIGARPSSTAATAFLRGASESDGGSPIPAWISQHTPTKRTEETPDSSDKEVLEVVEEEVRPDVELPGNAKLSTGEKFRPKKPTSKAGPAMVVPGTAQDGDLPPAGASQPVVPIAAIPQAEPGGEIPIIIKPEKLSKGRYLMELESTEGGVTDLAGDTGAVGRFSLSGSVPIIPDHYRRDPRWLEAELSPAREGMLLDLKGVIYKASLVPCATTLLLMNIQPTEAKVEALLNNFVSLREIAPPGGATLGPGNADDFFMYDDDDNYQVKDLKPTVLQMTEDGEMASKAGGKRKAKQQEAGNGAPTKKRAPPKPGPSIAAKKKPSAKKQAAKKPTAKKASRKTTTR